MHTTVLGNPCFFRFSILILKGNCHFRETEPAGAGHSLSVTKEENIKGLPLEVKLREFNFYTFNCIIAMILRKKIVGKSGL